MLRDDRFQRFEVVPITGALGAEIRGATLDEDAEDGLFEEVRRALLARLETSAARAQMAELAEAVARGEVSAGAAAQAMLDGLET